MTDTVFDLNEPSLLVGFMGGDKISRELFPRAYKKEIASIAASVAPDLVMAGLAEDIVSETWVILLERGEGAYDPERASPLIFLRYVVRDAARRVRAQNTPPGQRTRLQRREDGSYVPQVAPLSLDEEIETADGYIILKDVIPDERDLISEIVQRIDAEILLSAMRQETRSEVVSAVEHMYLEEAGISEAAERVGVNRSTLRRWIREWSLSSSLPLAV